MKFITKIKHALLRAYLRLRPPRPPTYSDLAQGLAEIHESFETLVNQVFKQPGFKAPANFVKWCSTAEFTLLSVRDEVKIMAEQEHKAKVFHIINRRGKHDNQSI